MTTLRTDDVDAGWLRELAKLMRERGRFTEGKSHAARIESIATRLVELLKERDTIETERADLWRKCRDLSGDCDVLKAANGTLREERDEARNRVDTAIYALRKGPNFDQWNNAIHEARNAARAALTEKHNG